ncbi:MAG: restriction endonuclease subunit S [Anaerolineae bacterium]|nr:restriction endonuclease subunit S [Anaerolineae bacterium]
MSSDHPFTTIGELANVKGGKRLPKGNLVQDEETAHPYIRVTDFRPDGLDPSNVKYIDDGVHKRIARYTISSDDVYISIAGTIGLVGIVPQRLSGANLTENAAKICDIDPSIDKRFLMYYLRSPHGQARIAARTVGTSQPKLALFRIKQIEVSLPPLPTQRKIAAILSAYDDLIENNTRRIAILEEIARNLYREWFVHFRFPGHEDIDLVDSPLGPVPEGWQIKLLGEIAQEIRRNIQPDQVDPKTPYIGLGHMPRKSIALSEWGTADETKSTKLEFRTGEILFGKIRPYFHKVGVAPVDGVCSTDAIVIVPRSPEWFSIVLGCVSSVEFVDYATQTSKGTKMPRADWGVLLEYPVPIPPSPVFLRFSSFMEDVVAQVQNAIHRNRNLRSTRDLLLHRLVSGQIDTSILPISVSQVA